MLKSEGGTMTTTYMLFKKGRNIITDTQWFVNHHVNETFRESDLKWIAQSWAEFEHVGVYTEDGEPFTFLSKNQKSIPDGWIEVRPDNVLGEL